MSRAALVAIVTMASCGGRVAIDPCPRLLASLALTTAELARIEGDVREMNARLEAKDDECDIYCAAQERMRNEMASEVREQRQAARACIPRRATDD